MTWDWSRLCAEAVELVPEYADVLAYGVEGRRIVKEIVPLFDAGWQDDEILHEARRRGVTGLREQRAAAAYLVALRQASAHEAPASDPEDEPILPGGLRWSQIEQKYRHLAEQTPGANTSTWRLFRRRHPREPSRPEVASAFDRSPSTLVRACVAAGRGPNWPPEVL